MPHAQRLRGPEFIELDPRNQSQFARWNTQCLHMCKLFGTANDEAELTGIIKGEQVGINYFLHVMDRTTNAPTGKPANCFWKQRVSMFPRNPDPSSFTCSDRGTLSQDRDLTADSEAEFIGRWKGYATSSSSGSSAMPITYDQG